MDVATFVWAWLVVFLGYFIRGITGAGSGLIAIPVLAQFMPIQTVVPLMLLLDFTASCAMSRATRRQGNWGEIRRLLPAAVVGVGAGTLLLVKLPQQPLLLALGGFVLVFGLRNVALRPSSRPISPGWAHLAGLTGGAIGAVFGTGGPPYMIYLGHRIQDKSELRATFSRLFVVEGFLRIVTFAIAGLLLKLELLVLWSAGLTALSLGLRQGGRVHHSLSNAQVQKLIGGLLILSGATLIARAL